MHAHRENNPDREGAVKRLFCLILLLCGASVLAEDFVVTISGDSLAGVSRKLAHITSQTTDIGLSYTVGVFGLDSASSTAHTYLMHYSTDELETWATRVTRPFGGGYASSETDVAMSLFKGETTWVSPPTTYSGSNMQIRNMSGTVVSSLDSASPAATLMATGMMRWTGDTIIYAYHSVGEFIVVKSGGAWSQSVSWGAIDTLSISGTPFSQGADYDYCGSGVIIYDRIGRDVYWIDGTVNDAIKTLGTDKVPTALSTNAINGTALICDGDSLVYIAQYCARDTAIWLYAFYATGGSRKTGLTLIDSAKVVPKDYLTGNAVDSLAPMLGFAKEYYGGVRFFSKIWKNTSNLDSVCINYTNPSVLTYLPTPILYFKKIWEMEPLTFGEVSSGKRFFRVVYPKRNEQNYLTCFWQEALRSPDTIWCSRDFDYTLIEPIYQVPSDIYSTQVVFDSNLIEDMSTDSSSSNNNKNFGGSVTNTVKLGSASTGAYFLRPLVAGVIPSPSHVVSCSLRVTVQTAGGAQVAALAIYKPAVEGTLDGVDPGASAGATHRAWDAANDDAAKNWQIPNGSATTGTADYNTSTGGRDRSASLINPATWSGFNSTGAKNTTLNSAIGLDHLHKYINGYPNDLGWVRLHNTTSGAVIIHSSEATTRSNSPRMVLNVYYSEPGCRKNNFMSYYRKRYITPGLRRRRI